LSAVEKTFTLGGQEVSVARSIPMKEHRHQTAGARKDLPRHANQQQIVEERDKVPQGIATTVVVNNLPLKLSDDEVKAHFEKEVGPIAKMHLGRTEKGDSRGFAFIEFTTTEHGMAALALNDSQMGKKTITVSRSNRAVSTPLTEEQKAQQKEAKDKKREEEKGKEKGKGEGKGKGKGKDKGKGKGKGKDGGEKGKGKKGMHTRLGGAEENDAPSPAANGSSSLGNDDFRKFIS
jgi:RNA recognition motif-containing protein